MAMATTPAERYAAIVKAFAGRPGVSAESSRGFGSSALKVDNRIFAMLASGDRFVVKLPRKRVDVLVDGGEGERFDPRRNGKLMKEWFVVGPRREVRWLPLAQEAFEFAQVEKSKRA
jgi:hypothetical protein